MPDKLEKLNKLREIFFKTANESVAKGKFEEVAKTLLDLFLKLGKNLTERIDNKTSSALSDLEQLKKNHKEIIQKIGEENRSTLSNLKKWVLERVDFLFISRRIEGRISDKITEIDNKLTSVKDGKDGKDAEPLTPDLILDKISGFLEINDIKGLKEELDKLKKEKGGRFFGGGGFSKIAMDFHIIDGEVVSGSGTTWTLSRTPNPASSLKLYGRGQRLRLTTDYTISNLTITTIDSWSAGDIIGDYNI